MLSLDFLPTDITTWLLIAVATVTFLYILTSPNPRADLPPTPGRRLPIFGHLFLVKKNPLEQFIQWKKRLGDVFMIQMGQVRMIVLSGHQVMVEAFVKQAEIFSDRHVIFGKNANVGVLFSSGPNWKAQRSTSLGILREFGMGKNILADKIADEVEAYMTEISKLEGQPSDLGPLTNMCVSNVICAIIFGKRFELDDAKFIRMMQNLRERVQGSSNTSAFRSFPILVRIMLYLPFDPTGLKKIMKLVAEESQFSTKIVEELLNDPDAPLSFVGSYMREMTNKEQKSPDSKNYLDKKNLLRNISHLFIAGTETTASAISWCFLHIIHNPKVGEKIYNEISENIGLERPPSMQDRPRLRYLQAVILETLRIGNVVPLSLIHKSTEDAFIGGYFIPKNSMIVPNLYSVLMNEEVWGDPYKFRPERFLDANGDIIKSEQLVPFSLGRRVCLGESLARMELFLFLAATFQRFKIMAPDPDDLPEVKGVYGVTMSPKPFKIKCLEREHFKN